MTFVDSNVFMYAVGRPHPLKTTALAFFLAAYANGTLLSFPASRLNGTIVSTIRRKNHNDLSHQTPNSPCRARLYRAHTFRRTQDHLKLRE